MTEQKIKYVKHPVSAKEKAKLRKAGFTIVDARFDPNPKSEPSIVTGTLDKADDYQSSL